MRLITGVRYTEEEKYGEVNSKSRYPAEGAVEDDAWIFVLLFTMI